MKSLRDSVIWVSLMLSVVGLATAAPAQTSPITGVYRITTKSQPTMCLEIAGFGNVDGTTVDMNIAQRTSNQQWFVEAQSDGAYKIYGYSGQNSLQMLDNNGGAYAAVVHTWEDLAVDGQSDTNQRWYFVSMGGGYYRIIPAEDGASSTSTLDVGQGDPGGSAGEDADVWTYYGSGNQLFKLDWSGASQIVPNPKKGLPTVPASYDALSAGLHCSWIYNWGYNPPADLPSGIEFVPMVWGWTGDTNIESEVLAANPGMTHVLGFNEPDEPNSAGGSNMTVAEGLQGFQYISAMSSLGIQIGSPACAVDSGSWMKSFMSQATVAPYNYHIDFVGFHTYSSESDPTQAANGLLGYVDYIHNLYGYPMWITEFSSTSITSAQALTYVRIVCQGLDSRSYIQRYSLFTSEPPAASGWGSAALVNSDGTFTSAGRLYARM